MEESDSSRYEPENGRDTDGRIGRGPAKHLVQTMRALRTTDVGHGARGEPRRGLGRTPEKSGERAKGNIGARGISPRERRDLLL